MQRVLPLQSLNAPLTNTTPAPIKAAASIEYNTATRTLDRSQREFSTTAEKELLPALVTALEQAGITGEISLQETLPIPLSKKSVSEAIRNQLKEVIRRYRGVEYCLRRADMLFEKYGLVIEVDGSAHDGCDNRVQRDVTREAEYALLGFHVIVVCNRQIYDPAAKALVLKEILEFIAKEQARPGQKQRYQTRRTALCRLRKTFLTANPTCNIGQFERKADKRVGVTDSLSGTRQWNGIRVQLRAKTKKIAASGSVESPAVQAGEGDAKAA